MLAEVMRLAALLIATSVLAFATLRAMPGDPVDIALAAWNVAATPETVEALRRQWGLDRDLARQYLAWLGRFLIGDWGVSFRTGRPILTEMAERLPVSAALGFGGLALAFAAAVPLGFLSARRPRGAADWLTRGLNVLTQSVPSFWLGLLLLWTLGVKLQLIKPFASEGGTRLLLPILLVSLYSVGSLARVYRTELLAASREPYFLAARAKGLGTTRALWSHGHRAALFAMVAATAPEFAWVIGGTAVIEVVFVLPGISQFLVQSVAVRDYFVLQAYIVTIGGWMLLVRLGLEAALRLLEPRLR
jgi:ABC-type dipeptide/oligopeptide/nickel transport system permease component